VSWTIRRLRDDRRRRRVRAFQRAGTWLGSRVMFAASRPRQRILLPLLLLFLLARPPGALGQLYEWTDENGIRHLTDDPNQVPEGSRPRVRTWTPSEPPSGTPAPPPHGREESLPGAPAPAPREPFTVAQPPPEWTRIPGVAASMTWRNTRTHAIIAVAARPLGNLRPEVLSSLSEAALSEIVVSALPIVLRDLSKGRAATTVVRQGPVQVDGRRFYEAVMNVHAALGQNTDAEARLELYLLWSPRTVYEFALFAPLVAHQSGRAAYAVPDAYENGHAALQELMRTLRF
jgi:hypothetical protein